MWKKLKELFAQNAGDIHNEPSIQKLVNANALNKRKNARVKYPHFGAMGPFPKVFFNNTELFVGNVSVGGVLIIDDTERLGQQVGEIIQLDLVWNDLTAKMRSRVVGANLQRRHVQFIDFNPQVFLRISLLVKPGYLGARFHRILNISGQLQVDEMWLGPNNENLIFNGEHISLTLGQEKICFRRGHPAVYERSGQPITVPLLNECLVLLANLPEPSARVKVLLEMIETELKVVTPARTGSYG